MLKIQEVPLQYVNQVWPEVKDFIAAALLYAEGDYDVNDAKMYVVNGQWSLIVAIGEQEQIKGAATIQYFNRPNDRVAFMTAIGGRLVTSPETFKQFSDILRINGATYLEGATRDTTARLWAKFGAEEKYRIVGCPLK